MELPGIPSSVKEYTMDAFIAAVALMQITAALLGKPCFTQAAKENRWQSDTGFIMSVPFSVPF